MDACISHKTEQLAYLEAERPQSAKLRQRSEVDVDVVDEAEVEVLEERQVGEGVDDVWKKKIFVLVRTQVRERLRYLARTPGTERQ